MPHDPSLVMRTLWRIAARLCGSEGLPQSPQSRLMQNELSLQYRRGGMLALTGGSFLNTPRTPNGVVPNASNSHMACLDAIPVLSLALPGDSGQCIGLTCPGSRVKTASFPCSRHIHAAIHVQCVASDVTALWRGEIQHRLGNLLRLPQTTKGYSLK